MDRILQFFSRAEFYLVLLVFAGIFIYFSFFDNIPFGSDEGIAPSRRELIDFPLLVVGGILFIASITIYISSKSYAGGVTSIFKALNIKKEYLKLTPTQKFITETLYRWAQSELSVDKLYDSLNSEEEKFCNSRAELYYRLKDLDKKGLLKIKKIGNKATTIITIPEIRVILNKLQLFTS